MINTVYITFCGELVDTIKFETLAEANAYVSGASTFCSDDDRFFINEPPKE